MDNLINMQNHLPFVHVDVSTVSAAVASQLSGSVGGGDTRTFSRPGPLGTLGTISRSVMRPFNYSVTPLRSDTLTITAAPVIGTLSNDTGKTSELVPGKITKTTDANGRITTTSTELTPKPSSPITIYDIYESFGRDLADNALMESVGRPGSNEYVPGALKWRAGKFYYIAKSPANQVAYTNLCMALLKQSRTKAGGGGTSRAMERTLNEFQDLKARESLP